MSATREDLSRFHNFAATKIDAGQDGLSLQELLDQWQLQNPDPDLLNDDVLAVKAAMRDLDRGDRGVPFDEHLKQLASQFGLESTP